MNSYLEYLQFAGKCLTLDIHPERKDEITAHIGSGQVTWEKIVACTSGQFVMPAFYILLKRHDLLHNLPPDLVEYFERITQLNFERNRAITEEIKMIKSLLSAHNIYPVFLKGAAHLLLDLYKHPAERMIGDIDFLVPESQMEQTAEILIKKKGFEPLIKLEKEWFKNMKHFPRLTHKRYVSSVEVHKEVLIKTHQNIITGDEIYRQKRKINFEGEDYYVPSTDHLMVHNIFNAQLNDKSYVYGTVLLRQMYDLLLLVQHGQLPELRQNYPKQKKIIDSYLASVILIFGQCKGVALTENINSKILIRRIKLLLKYPLLNKINQTILYIANRLYRYISLPVISIFDSNERKLIYYRLSKKEWYINHLRSYKRFFKGNK